MTRQGEPYDRSTAAPISKLHALTILSAEQQTMNFYLNVGPEYMEPIARQLYQEIAMVEEEHVTYYGSMLDPGETWWERWVNHEYNECYLYYSFMEPEERAPRCLVLHRVVEEVQDVLLGLLGEDLAPGGALVGKGKAVGLVVGGDLGAEEQAGEDCGVGVLGQLPGALEVGRRCR